MQLLPAVAFPGDQIGLPENGQMLRDRLPGHVQPPAQLVKRLTIPPVQPIEKLPPARIGQSAKHSIVIHADNTELFGCLTMETYRLPVNLKLEGRVSAMRAGLP